MLVQLKSGNILNSKAQLLINPVNTVGVMGAGLALEFKKKFPDSYEKYSEYCKGIDKFKDYRYSVNEEKGKIIYNLPTKEHYRKPAYIKYIRRSLLLLQEYLNKHPDIKTIAIPAIGCGLGGLRVVEVLHQIIYWLRLVERPISVELYGFSDIKPGIRAHMLRHYSYDYRDLDKYTGVGSRELPESARDAIEGLAIELAADGYTLYTGDAIGSDATFAKGAVAGKGKFVRFAPHGRKRLKPDTRVVPPESEYYPLASKLVGSIHPAWRWLPQPYKELHIRNAFQVLGGQLDEPSEFLVCWTADGATGVDTSDRNTGGTRTAICLAEKYGIPVFNLANDGELDKLYGYMYCN